MQQIQQLAQLQAQMQAFQQQMLGIPQQIAQVLQQQRYADINKNIQKEYSFKAFQCTTKAPHFIEDKEINTSRKEGTLFLYIPKHFIILDTQCIPNEQVAITKYEELNVDSDDVRGRTIYNHHMYISDHPFMYYASFCDVTQAITAPGLYVVPDYRKKSLDEDMKKEKQIVYALVCNNFNQSK